LINKLRGRTDFFVREKNVGVQLCIDYWGLNEVTIKNQYLFPLIGEVLEQPVKARVYKKLDIRSAYNPIQIKEGDEWIVWANSKNIRKLRPNKKLYFKLLENY
jgi:ABC-type microcin C transport system permease subunit YejE